MIKVQLLAHTPEPEKLIATAAKLCYSDSDIETLQDNLTPEKIESFVTMLASLGHESPLEHVSFTFGIEGISRSCSHQLVRHRIASYSQKSQRYVNETGFEYVTPPVIESNFIAKSKYDTIMHTIQDYYNIIAELIFEQYLYEESENPDDVPKDVQNQLRKKAIEDARFVLPNACETKIVVTMNIRSLMNFFKHRCCCFSADTEVLTNHGWKYFKDCSKNDLFYSLNLDTGDSELVSPIKFISYDVDEDLVRVKSQFIDQLITKDHNVVVSTSYDNKHWQLMPISDVLERKRILMKRNANPIKGNMPTTFILPEVHVPKNNQYCSWDTVHKKREVPIKEFLMFLGFYLSDGCVIQNGQHYIICLTKGNLDVINKYKTICESLTSHTVNIVQNSTNCWKIEFHDRNLFNFLKPLGKAVDKHIPDFVWELDHTLLSFLYDGLCDGDMKADGSAYSTISKQFADDLQRLLLHIGFSGSVSVIDRVGRCGGTVLNRQGNPRTIIHKHPEYRVSINHSKNEPIIKDSNRNPFSFEHYDGTVYCVELEKNHTLYVRRNGFVSWSGNCRAQWEIRTLAYLMWKECYKVAPILFTNVGPDCYTKGKCSEGKMSCGQANNVKALIEREIFEKE